MLKSKALWTMMMAGSLVGWLLIVIGLVKPIEDARLKKGWRQLSAAWGLGHPLEMLFALPIGKAAGLTTMRIVLKTMLFGFTWWVPVYFKVFKK